MKVLWFSNTPANAEEYLKDGSVGGGWLKSLDKVLQTRVELHIAFYYPKKNTSFKYLNTTYHPIGRKNWKLKVLKELFWHNPIDKQDLQAYLQIIEKVGPDIIHIQGTENPFGCIIPNINIPVIVSLQGCMTVCSHKFLIGFTKRELMASAPDRGKNFKQYLRQKSFIRIWKEFKKMRIREQQNLKITKYIIGRTDWDKRITSVLAPDSKYFHCDELLRHSFYERNWDYRERQKLIIHTSNGNSVYKGFETLCEALFELNKQRDIVIEWRIAGIRADDEIVKVTRKKLGKRFPETGLLCLGSIDELTLAEMLCAASIYVSPSHIENSSNSLCEAMLLGMPCVATFAGGTGSMLKDGEEGILVQDGDPWAMAGAILELYRNPDLACKYGWKARERAIKRHDPDKIVSELIGNYTKILAEHLNEQGNFNK